MKLKKEARPEMGKETQECFGRFKVKIRIYGFHSGTTESTVAQV
jgi:hypothetical protein